MTHLDRNVPLATGSSTVVVGFAASDGQLGRTAAISNAAWILAADGQRVLIVDWTGDEIRTQDYLGPFHIGTRRFGEPDGDDEDGYESPLAFVDGAVDLDQVTVTRYAVPLGSRQVDVISLDPEPGSRSPDDTTSASHAAALVEHWHEQLRSLQYDYVLIDAPLDGRSEVAQPIAALCDAVAVFFTLRRTSVEQARSLTQRLFPSAIRGPRVVPVAVQVDDGNQERLRTSREIVRTAFRDFMDTDRITGMPVELPYYPNDAYYQTLAVLVDDPRQGDTVLAGYVRLARAITENRVTALAPVPSATKDRYRRRPGHEAPRVASRIMVAYAGVDRPWAEWVTLRLAQAGVEVVRVLADEPWPDAEVGSGVVTISSPAFTGSRIAEHLAQATAVGGEDSPLDVVNLVVAESTATAGMGLRQLMFRPAPPAGMTRILVGHRTEAYVSGQMLAHFGLFGQLGAEPTKPIRYPGRVSGGQRNLPPRNPDFAGRDHELEELRDRVLAGTGELTVRGPAGIGKSEIVKEYAHRFAYDYDVQWWIPGHDHLAARASLVRLADELVGLETGDPVGALLAALSTDPRAGRWLLIFDNVDDPANLTGLLPTAGAGQVIITARADAPSGSDTMPVMAFRQVESTLLLLARVPALSTEDAERVSDAVGRSPLTVWMASAWLVETTLALRRIGNTEDEAARAAVQTFLTRLDEVDLTESAGQSPEQLAATRVLAAVLRGLSEVSLGRIAVRLAQMCAHLSPEGVSLRLLCSPPMLKQLWAGTGPEGAALAGNATAVDAVLRTGERYGLFTINWGRRTSLRIHRVLQESLRTTVISAQDRAAWHVRVLAGLAGYAPTELEVDLPETRGKIGELQRHLLASGALDSDDPAVRRWVVNHTRYIYRHGDGPTWLTTVDLTERVVKRWRAAFGQEDRLTLRLQAQVANLHRALGHFDTALAADESALAVQRRTVGLMHRETLVSARGRAGDLGHLGRFDESFTESYEVYNGFRGLLGDDHPETMSASNNLAISAFLNGDTPLALALQLRHHDRQVRLFGADHIGTYVSAATTGIYLRESGRTSAAFRMTKDAMDALLKTMRPTDPTALWVSWMLAIAYRRRGNSRTASQRNARIVESYRQLLGETHPNVRGCTLSLAADLHASGKSAMAVPLAQQCLAQYEAADADHPYTSVCRMNLALYQRGAGRMREAFENGRTAQDALRDSLGETHPWTLLATANYATLLAGSGEHHDSLGLANTTVMACRELLRGHHPYTILAEANLNRMRDMYNSTDVGTWVEMDIDVMPN